jgi:hypothetical protein
MSTRLHRWIPLAVALLALRAADALAQGCAMCASSFEPNDPATKAFNASILFLMISPYAIFFSALGCVLWLYRRNLGDRRAPVVPLHSRRIAPEAPKEVTP